MEKKFYACILETPAGKVIYSLGADRESLTTGLGDYDSYDILECSAVAYGAACSGYWDELVQIDERIELGGGGGFVNTNPPVVLALIPGRDL